MQMNDSNAQIVENMSEEEIQRVQELYYKEFSQEIIERFATSKEKAINKNPILEDPLLKGKLADDFSVNVLKDSIFSNEAFQKRDITTFFERVYYDNYGEYEELDEKTSKELQSNESQFNSISQLIQGVKNNRSSQALCSQIFNKLLMILKIWKKNREGENIVLTVGVPERKLSIKIREIMKMIFIENKFIETILSVCENQGFVNFSLLFTSLKTMKKLFYLSMSQSIEKIMECWDVPNFLNSFDELIEEKSCIEKLVKDGFFERFINILKKSEMKGETYPLILKNLFVFTCFSKSLSADKIFEISREYIEKIAEGLSSLPVEKGGRKFAQKILYGFSSLTFILIKKTSKPDITESFLQKILPHFSTMFSKLKKLDGSGDLKAKELPYRQLKALVLLSKEESIPLNSVAMNNVSSILEKGIVSKYFSLESQQKMMNSFMPKQNSPNTSNKPSLRVITLCHIISHFLSQSQDGNQKENIQNSLSKLEFPQIDIFENLKIKNSLKLVNYCNEYFAQDSTLVFKDFLESAFPLVDNVSLVTAQRLISILTLLQSSVETDSKLSIEIGKWIIRSLNQFSQCLLQRSEIWHLSKDKIEAKKHQNYKLLKRFIKSYYQDTFSAMSNILQLNLSQSLHEHLHQELFVLKMKVLSVFESFGWSSNISISTYLEISESIPSLAVHLRTEASAFIRLFILPKKRKIDTNLTESAHTKLIRNFIQSQAHFIHHDKSAFLSCLPATLYFVKLVRVVFDNDYALYLEEQVAANLNEILKAVSSYINLDLMGVYFSRNSNDVDSLVDRYSFYSYGDAIFSNILFLFTSNGFSDTVQKTVWTTISMYIQSFQETLMKEPAIPINLENYKPKNRLSHDLRDQIEEISQELRNLNSDIKDNVLQKVVNVLLKA